MKKSLLFLLILLLLILGGAWVYRNYFPGRSIVSDIPQIGEVPVYAADQRPDSFVNINFATLTKAGFVVIQENGDGKPGEIIGNSRMLSAGTTENIMISVVRPTVHGESLFAVIYEDSGDGIFSPGLDVPFKDDDGDIIFDQFNIDINASKVQASPLPSSDLIRLEKPVPNQLVKSPLVVTGEARGYWYFEASFPVRMFDANGVELGVVPAQAQSEWMTTDFVPFKAVLYFKKPATNTGTLVLEKDNPSGLPENAAELRVPVSFDLANWPTSPGACKTTGCSGQLCVDEVEGDIVTTCEYKAEYACYKTAECKRQEDGKCGWTPTEKLVACLSAAFQSETGPQ